MPDFSRQNDASRPAQNRGRLGLLVPTLNCRELLEKQIDALRSVRDLADEIVVVDSHSTDGTVEFLTTALDHPRLRVVMHPRGLYQSWNAGLAQISAEYVLIATAGDTMPRAGLEHLLEVAHRFEADIVLSPPAFEGSHKNWPIHRLLANTRASGPFAVEADALLHWTFRSAGECLGGILGSSASNLYRTRVLQEHPFPTDAGPAGDVAWGLRHIQRCRVAVTPRKCAHFVHHPKRLSMPAAEIASAIFRHACEGAGILPGRVDARIPAAMGDEAAKAAKLHDLSLAFGPSWKMRPSAWPHVLAYLAARAAIRREAGRFMKKDAGPWPAHFQSFLGALGRSELRGWR